MRRMSLLPLLLLFSVANPSVAASPAPLPGFATSESRQEPSAPSANGPYKTEDVTQPELRRKLLEAMKVDQEHRKNLIEHMKKAGEMDPTLIHKVVQTDKKNRAWMLTVIDKHGWPGATLVGEEGAHAAWILVQHADADVPFQRRCLDLMKEMPDGEVTKSDIAYLTDRVLCAEGKPQLYGTQLTQEGERMVPSPIEDEENLDKRRAAAGMIPMAEYLKQAADLYINQENEAESDEKPEKNQSKDSQTPPSSDKQFP